MKLLFYRWGSLSEPTIEEGLKMTEVSCRIFDMPCRDYHADAEFAEALTVLMSREKFDAVLSLDYFPIISMLCQINGIPYYSWVYDCPMNTMLSGTLVNDNNVLLCFDRAQTERMKNYGAPNAIHFPLWSDPVKANLVKEKLAKKSILTARSAGRISFVGNLYNDSKNRIRTALEEGKLTDYEKGFTEAIIEAQLLLYGVNVIKQSLTPSLTERISEVCSLGLGDKYIKDTSQLVADAIGMEVTARERINVLNVLADRGLPVDFYTTSSAEQIDGRVNILGPVDNEKELPLIYARDGINLNVTSKTIESGIPLRVLDILSCGGFCLTNYQPEIAEFFVDGEDLVMYTGMEDLAGKAEYYLCHDEERRRIAANGRKKVLGQWSIENRLKSIFEIK